MSDMEYTLDERVVRKPPADPVAALAEAMYDRDTWGGSLYWYKQEATAILAALDGWTLVRAEEVTQHFEVHFDAEQEAEIARLRAAIQAVLDDAESQHPGGWGPDVTTVEFLRAALAGGSDDD